jgi:predicted CoA-binding protein
MREKTTLVLGASSKPERYSYTAVKKLVAFNHPVIAVGLREGDIAGIRIQKMFPEVSDIHTISLYVGRANQSVYYDYILKIHPIRVIFNPGAENAEFEDELKNKGIQVVRGCTLIMLDDGTY